MGQKSNPISLRIGITRGWESNWYEEKSFGPKLVEDVKIRNYIKSRLENAGVSKVIIERTAKDLTITIHTSRPGVVIGRSGKDIQQLEAELKKLFEKDVKIQIHEIKRPELDAELVAKNIARQIENRISHRRAMKTAITAAMRMGAEGIRIRCGGRLAGAEMARSEQYKEGRIPLHTFRADIDYATATAQTIYGTTGVKTWICRGEIFGKTGEKIGV